MINLFEQIGYIKIVKFIKKNTSYFIAGSILIIVLIYSGSIPEVKKIEDNKDIFRESSEEDNTFFVLDRENLEKTQKNILSSNKNDFYRLSFEAKSLLKDEEIVILTVSQMGEEKEIGRAKLIKKDNYENFEFIFGTDDYYKGIVFRRNLDNYQNNEWDDNRIYINQIKISRLNVENQQQAENLRKTFFGDNNIENVYLISKEEEFDLSQEGQRFCKAFNSSGGFLTAITFNFDQIGNGGMGNYRLEIRDEDEKDGKRIGKVIEKERFSINDLNEVMRRKNSYKINFSLNLEENKKYFICINNKKIKTDKNNYLKIIHLEEEKIPENSFFLLEMEKNIITDNGKVLSNNATIEDLGDILIYKYKNRGEDIDILDVYKTKGDAKFSKDKETIIGKIQKGNYIIYKFDTIFPFEEMNIKLKELGGKEEIVDLNYSFDGENWRGFDLDNKEGVNEITRNDQDHSFIIENENEENTEFYLKEGCLKSSENKKNVFGLKELEIVAELKRY